MCFLIVSVLPFVGMCTMPLSVICVMFSFISGVASVIRTTLNPSLEGRQQALMGLLLCLLWGCGAALVFVFVSRAH